MILIHTIIIEHRVEQLGEGNTNITIKDDKENFINPLKPSKFEIGKISEIILDKVNKVVIKPTKFNQCKNTDIGIVWFKSLV